MVRLGSTLIEEIVWEELNLIVGNELKNCVYYSPKILLLTLEIFRSFMHIFLNIFRFFLFELFSFYLKKKILQ